jgi:CheY-like chemotaxis protein
VSVGKELLPKVTVDAPRWCKALPEAHTLQRPRMERILVIDDNRDMRDTLSALLQSEGWAVTVASNGREGLALQRKFYFAVVITDIFMPEQDGVETASVIRREFPRTKIVAMSGGGERVVGDYLRVLRELDVVTMKKPFDFRDLVRTLREMLHQSDQPGPA